MVPLGGPRRSPGTIRHPRIVRVAFPFTKHGPGVGGSAGPVRCSSGDTRADPASLPRTGPSRVPVWTVPLATNLVDGDPKLLVGLEGPSCRLHAECLADTGADQDRAVDVELEDTWPTVYFDAVGLLDRRPVSCDSERNQPVTGSCAQVPDDAPAQPRRPRQLAPVPEEDLASTDAVSAVERVVGSVERLTRVPALLVDVLDDDVEGRSMQIQRLRSRLGETHGDILVDLQIEVSKSVAPGNALERYSTTRGVLAMPPTTRR